MPCLWKSMKNDLINHNITKVSIRRLSIGIWRCNGCKTNFAGGAWELS